jgi:hypothetical protein
MKGAHQRSAVDQPYGSSSGGVCMVSGVGLRKENRLVKKKPPLAVICLYRASMGWT